MTYNLDALRRLCQYRPIKCYYYFLPCAPLLQLFRKVIENFQDAICIAFIIEIDFSKVYYIIVNSRDMILKFIVQMIVYKFLNEKGGKIWLIEQIK